MMKLPFAETKKLKNTHQPETTAICVSRMETLKSFGTIFNEMAFSRLIPLIGKLRLQGSIFGADRNFLSESDKAFADCNQ